MEAHGQLG
ncbi:hypothetical protein MP638_003860 [Amoeboaphelidium occidentale]|nr:hypothetical protein MP638_003860 [Amoeboaphelidium occidentale]